jgi:hypothetical protein
MSDLSPSPIHLFLLIVGSIDRGDKVCIEARGGDLGEAGEIGPLRCAPTEREVWRPVLVPKLPTNDEMQQATSLPACDEIGPLVPAAGRSPSPWRPPSPPQRLVTNLAPSPTAGARRRRSSARRRRTRLPGRSSVLLYLSASSRILLRRLPNSGATQSSPLST